MESDGANVCSLCSSPSNKFYHTEVCIRQPMHTQFEGIFELRTTLQKILKNNDSDKLANVCRQCDNGFKQIYSCMDRYSKSILLPIKETGDTAESSELNTIVGKQNHETDPDRESPQFSNGSRLAMIQTCKKAVVRLKKLKMVTIDINLKIEYDENSCKAATHMSVENEVGENSLESSPTGFEIEECQQNQDVKCEENIHTGPYQVIKSSNISGVLTQSYLTKNELLGHCEQKSNVENTFEYDQCRKSIGTKGSLDRHKRKIHGGQHSKLKRRFKCDKCERSYRRKNDLRVHKELHAGNIFYCDECNHKAPTKRYLHKHKNVVHSSKRFKCDQCEKDFPCKINLKRHKELHLEAIHDCDQCNRKFSSNRRLQNHKYSKHSRIRFKCDQCEKDFPQRQMLNNHKERHAGLVLNCDQCNHQFATNRSLHIHKNDVHSGERFKCDQCKKDFSTKRYLKKHKELHTRNTFNCDQCECKFPTNRCLERHKRKSHDSQQSKLKMLFKCDKCERSYRTEGTLRTHKAIHAGNILYCDECNHKSPTKQYLHLHKVAVHSGKRFKCDQCEKDFAYKWYLKRHKELHLEAIHDCDQCNRKFSTNRFLQIHKNNVHSGKRFKCDQCEDDFASKYGLIQHKKLHIELIHDCHQSSLKFSTNRYLQNHKSETHDDERFKCDQSEKHLVNKHRLNLLEIVNAMKVAIKRLPIRKKINRPN